eukprot:TRINITY_DN14514_c0_g1_i1.p3 TRINITY_DN14514_c0_g1~~TRINITY_DN14514_c0_g1_i1.p3  ORF type:complete len:301 (+),score=62.21 TRINITY_DN14514_c0_g1_i1:146-1048(+)
MGCGAAKVANGGPSGDFNAILPESGLRRSGSRRGKRRGDRPERQDSGRSELSERCGRRHRPKKTPEIASTSGAGPSPGSPPANAGSLPSRRRSKHRGAAGPAESPRGELLRLEGKQLEKAGRGAQFERPPSSKGSSSRATSNQGTPQDGVLGPTHRQMQDTAERCGDALLNLQRRRCSDEEFATSATQTAGGISIALMSSTTASASTSTHPSLPQRQDAKLNSHGHPSGAPKRGLFLSSRRRTPPELLKGDGGFTDADLQAQREEAVRMRRFACEICGRAMQNAIDLEDHILDAHDGEGL